jgi:hypothetical protein
MAVCVIVPRRMIMGVLVLVSVVMLLLRAKLTRVLVWMVMSVMIVLFHSAHLTSLAQGSA